MALVRVRQPSQFLQSMLTSPLATFRSSSNILLQFLCQFHGVHPKKIDNVSVKVLMFSCPGHVLPHEMTQLPQDEFETCLEKAEAWMKEIHVRLKENDNTQGPRSALESRLRETEKICALEPDGRLLLDLVLTKAEAVLGDSSDDEKHDIHVKLGKIKAMFEETTTYMMHCHSRIEWVWLHWNEYLRARDQFSAWVHDMTLMLEPDMELQLGRKEKCWQYEQAQVLLRDVNNHSKLVDRLLEEASSLYNRIGDPSVDESVQNAMVNEYKQIKKKTQERTQHLEKIWRDHEAYEKEVNLFKSWLNGVIEKLKCCVGSAFESTETRLNLLQEIGKDVKIGKKQLELLEERSAEVIKDTSPLGADKICRELEELRRTLAELKVMNDEEEEGLLKTYNSDNTFLQLAQQLEANINEFRKAVQRLEESLESGEKVKSEEELIALWKTLNVTKSALAGLEAKAERVKVQLKDLFKFSKDVQPLSDNVIAAMREYQRVKSKAFKLSTDTETELRQLFQNPLREFLYWKPIAESVLDATAGAANNGPANYDVLERIEKLLEESDAIREKLTALEARKDRMHSVLGDDRTKLLLRDVAAAEVEREELHRHLSQRKSQLQNLAAQSEEFDSAYRLLHQKLSALRIKCAKENEMQPDIIGKEAQLQRLQILLEELTELHIPIKELRSKTEASANHAHRASKLLSDYLTLQRTLENNIRKTKEYINCHWMFNNGLLDLQRWIMETRQELESYLDGSRDWGEREVEALLVEVSEKDIQRHQVEAQGQLVIESSSPEGAAVIHTELNQLMESWESLRHLCEQLSRSLKERASQRRSPATVIANPTSNKQDVLQISVQYDDSHNGHTGGHHGGFSGTDIDGYSSSSSSKDDSSDSSNRTQTGHTGNLSSKNNRSLNLNITGKANSGFNNTEVDLVHNGGSSRFTSPAQESKSSDKSTKSLKSSTEMNTTNGRSRIPRHSGISGSHNKSSKSVESSTEVNITNGKSSASQEHREELNITPNFKISQNKTKPNTRIIAENSLKEGERNSPDTRGTSRGERTIISIAESVDVVDSSSSAHSIGGKKREDDHMKLLMEFEQWLKMENKELNRVCAEESSRTDGESTRQSRLRILKSRVPQGQKLFGALLQCRPAMSVTEDLRLEDLRYRWMLYKSKLRDSGSHTGRNLTHEPRDVTKKSGGICSFLHRVCCAALPLQLLLLLLLLLAFLLPLVHESQNCALANNFAHSFNLMLKYDGPPPT
ncbi:PREDICTED: nesprin-3 [Nanorana parkeri]|uniref:nesprin-3 n=1 Tax=Nanorana parkeri TaxID=125878 RepID=UPI000854EB6E|nr:PREDICTED: nesprin-3 [Nanorana parkeri]